MRHVRLAGRLEFEAQFVRSGRYRVGRCDAVQAAAEVVVDVVQPAVLEEQRVAAGRVPWDSRTPSAPPSGISTVAVMECGRFKTRGPAANGTDWVFGRYV